MGRGRDRRGVQWGGRGNEEIKRGKACAGMLRTGRMLTLIPAGSDGGVQEGRTRLEWRAGLWSWGEECQIFVFPLSPLSSQRVISPSQAGRQRPGNPCVAPRPRPALLIAAFISTRSAFSCCVSPSLLLVYPPFNVLLLLIPLLFPPPPHSSPPLSSA